MLCSVVIFYFLFEPNRIRYEMKLFSRLHNGCVRPFLPVSILMADLQLIFFLNLYTLNIIYSLQIVDLRPCVLIYVLFLFTSACSLIYVRVLWFTFVCFWFTFVCFDLRLFALIYVRVLLFTSVCFNLRPFALIYVRVLWFRTVCFDLVLVLWFTPVCFDLRLCALI